MAKHDYRLVSEFTVEEKLLNYNKQLFPLHGLSSPEEYQNLACRILKVFRKISALSKSAAEESVRQRIIDPFHTQTFDPAITALWHFHQGETEEAHWLLFLAAYLGEHPKYKWNLVRDIYSALSNNRRWTWERVSLNKEEFNEWLSTNQPALRRSGGFGEIHKFPAFDYNRSIIAGKEIMSYINWVSLQGCHRTLFINATDINQGEAQRTFNYLYHSMKGHTPLNGIIIFKYLSLIANIGLIHVEPDSLYLADALLVKKGARLLFSGKKSQRLTVAEIEDRIKWLVQSLDIPFGWFVLHQILIGLAKENIGRINKNPNRNKIGRINLPFITSNH